MILIPLLNNSLNNEITLLSNVEAILDKNLKCLESNIMENLNKNLESMFEAVKKKPILFFSKCNMCGVNPIQNAKFSCLMCEDYNLCEKCEPQHSHPTLKFKTLDFSNKTELANALSQKIKENRSQILSELGVSFENQKKLKEVSEKQQILKVDPQDIIFDFPSEFFLVPVNTHFLIPIILTNNSTKAIPKGSFLALKNNSDIFIENKFLTRDINPGETIQIEIDCLSNKYNKSYVVDISLWDKEKIYEFHSFSIHIDVSNQIA